MRGTRGITLIALIVTLIVLLILAGVSIAMLTGENGIIAQAQKAKKENSKAEAREKLEMVLNSAQVEKKTNSEYNENDFLDEYISNEIENVEIIDNIIIVDNYAFEIDRSVPKIAGNSTIENQILITAKVSNNASDGWVKPSEAEVSITGIIKTFSGGNITKVIAKKGSTPISDFSIETNGRYKIENITEDTTITIEATDSNGNTNSKTIDVQLRIDGTGPVMGDVTSIVDGLNIELSAIATDTQSGVSNFHYNITPEEGVTPVTGDFNFNEKVIIKTTIEATYTIRVKAIDKCGNESEEKEVTIQTKGKNTKKIAPDGEWWLPKGFIESSESSSTIQGGKVIEDKTGNQFVWIPCYVEGGEGQNVTSVTEYKRTDFGKGIAIDTSNDQINVTDFNSIKKYGGFYIGRFEAGNVNNKVVVKKGQTAYSGLANTTANNLATNFADVNNYEADYVYSKLTTGQGWDTTLKFIEKSYPTYPTNSVQGNYTGQKMKTGLTTPVCNIYDMGGNQLEYVEEVVVQGARASRGGKYNDTATVKPAGYREDINGKTDDWDGFRPSLYLK